MSDSPVKFKQDRDLSASALEKMRLHYDQQIRALLAEIRELNQRIASLEAAP